jgi:hypothetical protein
MKHKREIDTSYFHNPVVQGVNYAIFIMLLKEMVSMESKGHLGAVPVACPLISSKSSYLFRVVHVSSLPHHEIARGGMYIVGFWTRRVCEVQYCIERTHEGKLGPTTWLACGPSFLSHGVPY